MPKQSCNFLTDQGAASFVDLFCYLCFVFVFASLVVTCWEMTDLLALLYMMFSCDCVTFPYGIQGQM